jgi:hypothetical protein
MSGLGPEGVLIPVNAMFFDLIKHVEGISSVVSQLLSGSNNIDASNFFNFLQFNWNLTNSPGSTIVVVFLLYYLAIVFCVPNIYQIAAYSRPALGIDETYAIRPREKSWGLSIRWALGTALFLTAAILTFTRVSPFLYFQF